MTVHKDGTSRIKVQVFDLAQKDETGQPFRWAPGWNCWERFCDVAKDKPMRWPVRPKMEVGDVVVFAVGYDAYDKMMELKHLFRIDQTAFNLRTYPDVTMSDRKIRKALEVDADAVSAVAGKMVAIGVVSKIRQSHDRVADNTAEISPIWLPTPIGMAGTEMEDACSSRRLIEMRTPDVVIDAIEKSGNQEWARIAERVFNWDVLNNTERYETDEGDVAILTNTSVTVLPETKSTRLKEEIYPAPRSAILFMKPEELMFLNCFLAAPGASRPTQTRSFREMKYVFHYPDDTVVKLSVGTASRPEPSIVVEMIRNERAVVRKRIANADCSSFPGLFVIEDPDGYQYTIKVKQHSAPY